MKIRHIGLHEMFSTVIPWNIDEVNPRVIRAGNKI